MWKLSALLLALAFACASPRPGVAAHRAPLAVSPETVTGEPPPEAPHPSVGCIPATFAQQAQVGGNLQPAVVRILGTYVDGDGYPVITERGEEQWRVLLPGEFRPERWVPIAKSRIRFAGCGSEASAYSAEQPRR